MNYIYIIVALAVVAAAVFGVHSYNSAIKEAERLSGELTKANSAAAAWKAQKEKADAEIKRRDNIIAGRDTAREKINRELNDALATIVALKARDPQTRDWALAPLPTAVVERLRSDSSGTTARTDVPKRADDADGADTLTRPPGQ